MTLIAPFFTKSLSPIGRRIKHALSDDNHPRAAFVRTLQERPTSMLSVETLRAVHLLSGECRGAIVEIGAYIGGGTLTILHATQARQNLFVTMEEPVASAHPQIPTRNTVEDLHANIRSFSHLGRANHYIIPGASFETWVLGELHHRMVGNPVGLLVWDADACIDRDLILLSPFLEQTCLLVIDDYMAGVGKSARITSVIDDFTQRGILEPLAYLPWATWFGRLRRKPTPAEISEYRAEWAHLAENGDLYYKRLLDYQARLQHGVPAPLTFEERQGFWECAFADYQRRASEDRTAR
jgi:hypothetical protein